MLPFVRMLFCFRTHLFRVFRFGVMFLVVGFNIRLLGSMLGLDILRRLGRKWRSIKVSVHRLNIRVVGCRGSSSPSRNRVGLITGSRFRSSFRRVGCLHYIRLEAFLRESISSLRDSIASSTDAWKTPISCLS